MLEGSEGVGGEYEIKKHFVGICLCYNEYMVNSVLGAKIKTDNEDNTGVGFEKLLENSMDDGADSVTDFATRALGKTKARERRERDGKHSEPDEQYRQRRKEAMRKLGRVGTSKLDIRDRITDRQAIKRELRDYGVDDVSELDDSDDSDKQILSSEKVFKKFDGLFDFLGEDTSQGNPNLLEEYGQITDRKKTA